MPRQRLRQAQLTGRCGGRWGLAAEIITVAAHQNEGPLFAWQYCSSSDCYTRTTSPSPHCPPLKRTLLTLGVSLKNSLSILEAQASGKDDALRICRFRNIYVSLNSFPSRFNEEDHIRRSFSFLMPSHKLPNYLRANRKRAGFSQEEVAFLLGCGNQAQVSLYERSARLPTLKTALAYKAVFGTPIEELFAGIYQEIEREVLQRAEMLAQRIYSDTPDPLTALKLEFLRIVLVAPQIITENE